MSSPLELTARRAGAVIVDRAGVSVAAHYGSAAAELAVCVRAVGLADRSELGKLALEGTPDGVAELVRRMTGATLAASGVCTSSGAWWCAAAPGQVIVLCEPGRRERLLAVLRIQARRMRGVEVRDASSALSAIALVGRDATRVLSAVGVAGDPRSAPPFGRATLAGAEVLVLLQSDRRAILLVAREHAGEVWRLVERAGRPFGLSRVGTDAVDRFSLLDAAQSRIPALL